MGTDLRTDSSIG